MKLIIQIPCLNEELVLPTTLAALPGQVYGFETIQTLVIDDGSTDATAKVADKLGVDYVVSLNGHQGLARAFMAGLKAASEHGADVIVNIDADNQYDARDIERLVKPILNGDADLVVGARPIQQIQWFSPVKRLLQIFGSWWIRKISTAAVQDATSGFRAMTRETALRLNVFGDFTYTIETIFQARLSNLRVVSVPIRVTGPTRPSRLFRSNGGYILQAAFTIINALTIYRPLWFFYFAAAGFAGCGLILAGRYVFFMLIGEGPGHVQSVIACAVAILAGVFMAAIGIIAHLQSINRRLLEEVRFLLRSADLQRIDLQEQSEDQRLDIPSAGDTSPRLRT